MKRRLLSFFLAGMVLIAAPGLAHSAVIDEAAPPPPLTRSELEGIKPEKNFTQDENAMPIDIRKDAMKEAALSYGARGGLAWRTYHIRQEMETRSDYLDKVFDFRQLLIPAPSGLLIEPPIISEGENTLLINGSGQEAAVAERVYNIGRNARIVSAPRTWRAYLEREWGDIAPPPDILRPANKEEREMWIEWVRRGWEEGVAQADDIFQTDVNKLAADYQGMVRYRMLLAQGMVSPPYALQVDRGITGGGNEMRVGDRALSITGPSQLKPGYEEWQPANR